MIIENTGRRGDFRRLSSSFS